MRGIVVRLVVLAVCASTPGLALAVEGHIPINAPVTIGAPGRYVVTQNITAPGTIITVGSSDVDIDLNGFTLTSTGGGIPVISSSGFSNLTVRDGTLHGGSLSIDAQFGTMVVIEDVKTEAAVGTSIHVLAFTDVSIRRSIVRFAGGIGIDVDGTGVVGGAAGTIEGNLVERCTTGIHLTASNSIALQDNHVNAALGGDGILVTSSTGVVISRNTVEDSTRGIHLQPGSGHQVFENVVSGTITGPGILVEADSVFVLKNTISHGASFGIEVTGARNQIEDNATLNNGSYGLWLAVGSTGNVFRRNSARGNAGPGGPCGAGPGPTTDFCNDGINNNTFGDNFMPSVM
jgi:parallel beta-helix repeat protein